jgi:DNA polymerase III delta subunit
MLYVFHGTDTATSSGKMVATITAMRKKKPDASLFRIEDGKLTQDIVNELTQSQGLFEQKYIVEIQYPFEKADTKDVFLKSLKELSESENIFLVIEGKILKADLNKIEKKSEKLFENNLDKSEKKDSFNLFGLADAVGGKDKKNSWVILQNAFKRNISPEEIHGVLWWQVKSIYSSMVGNAKETGMKDFTYNKSKRFAEKYRIDDVEKIMNELIEMSHDAHLGERDFKLSLEKFILNI